MKIGKGVKQTMRRMLFPIALAFLAISPAHATVPEGIPLEPLVQEAVKTLYEENERGVSRMFVRQLGPGKPVWMLIVHAHDGSILVTMKQPPFSIENSCTFFVEDKNADGRVDVSGRTCPGQTMMEERGTVVSGDYSFFVLPDAPVAISFDDLETVEYQDSGTQFFANLGGPQETYEKVLGQLVALSPFGLPRLTLSPSE